MQPNERIFQKLNKETLLSVFRSIGATERSFENGEVILRQDEPNRKVCFLANGKAHAIRVGIDGRVEDYTVLSENRFFGDVLAISENFESPVTIIADTKSTVFSFPYDALLHSEDENAKWLLHYLLSSVAERFFGLQRRVFYLTRPTLREKIISYLSDEQKVAGKADFDIPFDRDGLAAYLCCDRSALSRELSLMQKDGLIAYKKAHFTLKSRQFAKKD